MRKNILICIYNWQESFFAKRSLRFKRARPIRAVRRRFVNYVIRTYKKSFVEIEGRKMYLDQNDSLRLSFKEYDKFGEDFLKTQINEGDVIVDLGANIGYWTLFFAQLVGKSGKVYAFEPEPSLFKILQKNVEVNDFENITLIQKAVSNISQKDKLFLSSNPNDHRIFDSTGTRKSIEIDTISLDDYFSKNDFQIDFIKSNVQGADFSAIEGSKNILKKSKNIKIMAEFSPFMLVEFNKNPEDFLDLLLNDDFFLYDLNRRESKIIPVDKKLFLEEYDSKKINGTYLYASRSRIKSN